MIRTFVRSFAKSAYKTVPASPQVFEVPITAKLKAIEQKIDENNPKVIASQHMNDWLGWLKFLRIRLGFTSNGIEGNSLTEKDIIQFIERGVTVGGKPMRDIEDVVAHDKALKLMFDIAKLKPEVKWTSQLIRDIHSFALPPPEPPVKPHDAIPGKYKTTRNFTFTTHEGLPAVKMFADPLDVPERMNDLCEWSNGNESLIHPLRFSAIMHYNIVCTHPFGDTNGRTSRIVMNLGLLRRGYSPCVIECDPATKDKYYQSLNVADSTQDLSQFTEFLGQCMLETQETLINFGQFTKT